MNRALCTLYTFGLVVSVPPETTEADSLLHINAKDELQATTTKPDEEKLVMHTCGGNASNAPCHFPFKWKGIAYNECSMVDNHGKQWCFTDKKNSNWGNCRCTTCHGTGDKKPCLFPFEYKGKEYNTCTDAGSKGKPWCHVDKRGHNWGYCECKDARSADPQPTTTCGGTGNNGECVFPFKYRGKTYNSCTRIDHANRPWCYVTTVSKKWGNCRHSDCKPTCGGNGTSLPCSFPFRYKGLGYNMCTAEDNDEQPWCYVSNNGSRMWGNCNCQKAEAGVTVTTMIQRARKGDTTISVASTSGFTVGASITIGDETHTISSIGSIVIKEPLAKDWPEGTEVKLKKDEKKGGDEKKADKKEEKKA